MIDTPCSHQDISEIQVELAEELELSFPEAYGQGASMAKLSLALRHRSPGNFCVLPFCHTVEGEALGGNVTYSGLAFPYPGSPVFRTAAELQSLPAMDFHGGRLAQVLEACRQLSAQGESIILNVSGPLTILNTLMNTGDVFSLLMEDSPFLHRALLHLRTQLLRYVAEARDAGVSILSYADPLSAENLLGPDLALHLAEKFTQPFLAEAQNLLSGSQTRLYLCPKTTDILIRNRIISPGHRDFSSIIMGPCIKTLQTLGNL